MEKRKRESLRLGVGFGAARLHRLTLSLSQLKQTQANPSQLKPFLSFPLPFIYSSQYIHRLGNLSYILYMQQAATANLLEFAAAKVCCGIIYELIEKLALEERAVVIGNELHVHHTLLEDYLFNAKALAKPT